MPKDTTLFGMAGNRSGNLLITRPTPSPLSHLTPILRSLHWLLFSQRIDFKIILFVYKSLHETAPFYLSELLHPYSPIRSLRSSDQAMLVVPRVWLKSRRERSFYLVGPRLWNSLPLETKMAPFICSFKSRPKTHLFALAFL